MWAHLFQRFWTPPNLNLTKVEVFADVLAEFKEFTPEDCEKILAATKSQEVKDALTKATQSAIDKGAFGAPWLWVRNDKGEAEPFFGSDRYVVLCQSVHDLLSDVKLTSANQIPFYIQAPWTPSSGHRSVAARSHLQAVAWMVKLVMWCNQ